MLKKIMLFSMTAVLLTLFAACGNNDKEESSASEDKYSQAYESNTEDSSESSTEEPSENKTEDNASSEGETLGQTLLSNFKDMMNEDDSISVQAAADAILTNPAVLFSGSSVPVEPGLLTGFGNTEITGFKEAAMFAPNISTIAFVGYIFELDENTDSEEFKQTLADNADPRWNICTEAEETVIGQVDNKVFFLMSPKSLEA